MCSSFAVRATPKPHAPKFLNSDPQNRVRSMAGIRLRSAMNSSNLPELKPFIRTMGRSRRRHPVFSSSSSTCTPWFSNAPAKSAFCEALGFTRFNIVQNAPWRNRVLTIAGSFAGILITFLIEAILKETNPRPLTFSLTPGWLLGLHWAQPLSVPPSPSARRPRPARLRLRPCRRPGLRINSWPFVAQPLLAVAEGLSVPPP